jgi:hypothetical protein
VQQRKDSDAVDEDMTTESSEEDDIQFLLMFGWIHIEPFVRQAIAAPPPGITCPFALPTPLTVEAFKTALLDCVRAPDSTEPHPLNNCVIQGNIGQFGAALSNISILNADPWFVAVASSAPGLVPIADVMHVRESSVNRVIGDLARNTGARLWN